MSRRPDEPKRDACRPVNDGPSGETEYIFTVLVGRGILHPHGPDGCPFEPGGPYYGRAVELIDGLGGCQCADCLGEGDHP